MNTSRIDSVDFKNLPFGKIFTDHMIVTEYKDGQWGRNQLQPYGPIGLVPSISALHYGQSVFEGMKVFATTSGQPLIFRKDAHLARMNRSLVRMAMPVLSEKVLYEAIKTLVHTDIEWLRRAGQLYIRPIVFATNPNLGVAASSDYLFVLLACPVGPYYAKPLNLKIEKEYSRSAPGGVGFTKTSGNYGSSMHPTLVAQQEGFDQLVWTDAATHTKVEESGTMNIMAVINGRIITPRLSDTILAGITRDSFLTLAKEMKIPIEERDLTVQELISCLEDASLSELFGVGTAATMIRIESVTLDRKKYTVPEFDENSIANRLYTRLDGIKRGTESDLFGWSSEV